ncbi:3-dehydroquinate synthase [Acidobacteria bacterium AH-259-O06]|nr:3-dehydroquinate synthase [Acidobacteria bacterium AH-259-O06]
MEKVIQCFTVDFNFPVYFTRDLFSEENPVFLEAVTRLESDKRHRVLFVIDQNVAAARPQIISEIKGYFAAYSEALELLGEPVRVIGGEGAKDDFAHVIRLVEQVNKRSIDRHSFMAIIGGGAVLDVACFAAAISHRGVRAIRIPTTVLSQSDSAVGVKSGINLFGKKNFLGTFSPPFAVFNDISFIDTLEHRDKIAGIAEAVKVALIRDRAFYEFLEANTSRLSRAEREVMTYQIRHSAQLHLEHIRTSGDPFEFGSARPLDFGHWSAHKLETMTHNRLRHGEAVVLGMALDSVYSMKADYLEQDRVERILTLLESLGFMLWDDALLRRDVEGRCVVLDGLQEFREHLGGILHITLLRDIGEGFEVTEMDERMVLDSICWLRERFEQRHPEVLHLPSTVAVR